jgi:hypothetical protein
MEEVSEARASKVRERVKTPKTLATKNRLFVGPSVKLNLIAFGLDGYKR